jgi:hypothetical protein
MRVAKGNIADWDVGAGGLDRVRGGYGDVLVGEGGASDGAQSLVADEEFFLNVQALADGEEGLAFAGFGALSVTDVQGRGGVVTGSESGADAGIHASAEQHDCALFFCVLFFFDLFFFDLFFSDLLFSDLLFFAKGSRS